MNPVDPATADDDVVSDLLRAVRVRSAVYCRSSMGAPWGFAVEAHGNPSFHVVKRTFGLPPGAYRSRPGPRRDQIAAAGLVGSSVGSPDSGKSSG